MRTFLLLLFIAPLLHANALDDLRARLAGLRRDTPVRAVVEYAFTSSQGDASSTEQGKATAVATEDTKGLTLFWGRTVLAKASAELEAHARNPEVKTPTRHILQSMDAGRVHEYFDAAGSLLRRLEGAEFVGEAPSAIDGKPARLLTLRLKPKLNAHDLKYVKQAEIIAKVWTDPTGVPLASDTTLSVKGRALLVITFETGEHELFRYTVRDGRLLVTRHERETTGSGGGEHGRQTSVTALTYEGTTGLRREQ